MKTAVRVLPPGLSVRAFDRALLALRGMPAFHRSEIGETELTALAVWVEALPPPAAR